VIVIGWVVPRLKPATVIVWPETEAVPALAVVNPAAVPVVDGALQRPAPSG